MRIIAPWYAGYKEPPAEFKICRKPGKRVNFQDSFWRQRRNNDVNLSCNNQGNQRGKKYLPTQSICSKVGKEKNTTGFTEIFSKFQNLFTRFYWFLSTQLRGQRKIHCEYFDQNLHRFLNLWYHQVIEVSYLLLYNSFYSNSFGIIGPLSWKLPWRIIIKQINSY